MTQANSNQFIRHELKTPLSVLRGYISMLLDGDYGELKLSPKQKEIFDKINSDIDAISDKINTLLKD